MRSGSTLVADVLLFLVLVGGAVLSADITCDVAREGAALELVVGGFRPLLLAGLAFCLAVCCAAVFGPGRGLLQGTFTARAFHFRLLLLVLVLHWLGQVVFLQPFAYLVLGTTAVVAAATYAGSILILAMRREVAAPVPRLLDICAFNLAMTPVLLEICLRLGSIVLASPVFARAGETASERLERSRYPPGALRFGFPCDKGGHYDDGPEAWPEGDRLVVTIGDSFSVGIVPHHFHFTTVSERELDRTIIYNMGAPSIDPVDYLHLLRYEALPLEPDLVVIDLFVGNDLRIVDPRQRENPMVRSWYDRDSLLLYLVPQRMLRALEEVRRRGGGENLDDTRTMERVEVEDLGERYPWVEDPLLEEAGFSDETYLGIETASARVVWTTEGREFPSLFRVLEEMCEVAGDTRLAVMLIPSAFQVEESVRDAVARRVPEILEDMEMPQRIVGQWCEDRRIPFLDLLPALGKVETLDDGQCHCYHRNDIHFNVRGNAVAGHALASFVSSILDVEEDRD